MERKGGKCDLLKVCIAEPFACDRVSNEVILFLCVSSWKKENKLLVEVNNGLLKV